MTQTIRDHFIKALSKRRDIDDPAQYADFADAELTGFIRAQIDADFPGIYEETRRKWYEEHRVKSRMSSTGADVRLALRYYLDFLDSKFFPRTKLPMEKAVPKKKAAPAVIPQPEAPETTTPTPPAPNERVLSEGMKAHVEFERARRNPQLRAACIAHYGYQCQVCGLDFAEAYGEELGSMYIEVHHLKPISTFDDEHDVDPITDLVPLCANCHAMIHRGKDGALTLGELRKQYKGHVWPIRIRKDD